MNKSTTDIEMIWQECHDQLLRFILGKVRNTTTAEDILQTVFLKIMSKINTLKNPGKLKSWLFQVTNNTIIDHYRGNKFSEYSGEDNYDLEDDLNENINELVGSWILPIIKDLPEKYQEALILSEIKGISQKELATHLGISYEGAKSRVQRGRIMLKEKLNQCCCFYADKYGNILSYQRRDNNCRE